MIIIDHIGCNAPSHPYDGIARIVGRGESAYSPAAPSMYHIAGDTFHDQH